MKTRKRKETNIVDSKVIFDKAFNHSLFFLKFRPRSEKEVIDNLRKFLNRQKVPHDLKEKILNEIVNRLKELKFIDDRDFVRYFIETRLRVNPKGKRVIEIELRQKGIKKDLVDEFFNTKAGMYPEEEIMQKLLVKADKHYYTFPYRERKQKLLNYVIRRGFSFDKVYKLVDEMLKKGVE